MFVKKNTKKKKKTKKKTSYALDLCSRLRLMLYDLCSHVPLDYEQVILSILNLHPFNIYLKVTIEILR